jgi:hypothetical protein
MVIEVNLQLQKVEIQRFGKRLIIGPSLYGQSDEPLNPKP